jgi:hypothetical protein
LAAKTVNANLARHMICPGRSGHGAGNNFQLFTQGPAKQIYKTCDKCRARCRKMDAHRLFARRAATLAANIAYEQQIFAQPYPVSLRGRVLILCANLVCVDLVCAGRPEQCRFEVSS